MEKFNSVTEPMELEFYSIEPDGKGGKQIHILGFLYIGDEDNGQGFWRNVEYTGFIEPLEKFVIRFYGIENYVDDTASRLNQYIGDHTDEQVVDIINHYFNGHHADYYLDYNEINMDTPCGNYCFRA